MIDKRFDYNFRTEAIAMAKNILEIKGGKLSHLIGKEIIDNSLGLETNDAYYRYIEFAINDILVDVVIILVPKTEHRMVHIPNQIGKGEVIYFLDLWQFTNRKYYKDLYFHLTNSYDCFSLVLNHTKILMSDRCDLTSFAASYHCKSFDRDDQRYDRYETHGSTEVYIPLTNIIGFDNEKLTKEENAFLSFYYGNPEKHTSILLPKFVINDGILQSCSIAKEVIIPDDVKRIKRGVFFNKAFETIVLNNGLETLDDYCFGYSGECSIVETIPSTLKYIGNLALPIFSISKEWIDSSAKPQESGEWLLNKDYGFKEFRFIVLPYALEYISPSAFDITNCFHLPIRFTPKEINVPFSPFPFSLEEGLKSKVKVGKNFQIIDSDNGAALVSNDSKRLIMFFNYASSKKLEPFEMPASCEIIEEGAFIGARINELVCSPNLKEIKSKAFLNSSIKRIIITGEPPIFSETNNQIEIVFRKAQ